jgi:hypothetical protein
MAAARTVRRAPQPFPDMLPRNDHKHYQYCKLRHGRAMLCVVAIAQSRSCTSGQHESSSPLLSPKRYVLGSCKLYLISAPNSSSVDRYRDYNPKYTSGICHARTITQPDHVSMNNEHSGRVATEVIIRIGRIERSTLFVIWNAALSIICLLHAARSYR